MFSRLTRSARIRFGWLIAAVYLGCVLAPRAALAPGSGPAPCLEALQLTASFQPIAAAPAQKSPPRTTMTARPRPGPCCAMLCVSALPAALPTFLKPQQPVSIALSETDRSMPGKAPPLLYRPPSPDPDVTTRRAEARVRL
jgi:hypothetical protein